MKEKVEVTVHVHKHIEMRFLPDYAAYLFFDNERVLGQQVTIRFGSDVTASDIQISTERFHSLREAICEFDDQLQRVLKEAA